MQKLYQSVSKTVTLLFLAALLLVNFTPATNASNPTQLSLDLTGLENLGDGWAYEGWLIVDGAPVTTGVFTIDDDGNMSQTTFTVSEDDAANASTFVLTIEPSPDDDAAPSDVHVLGGDFNSGDAALSVGHGAALGDDFMNAAGSYILAAPSGDNAPYQNGIWWLDPNAGPASSLDLPTLPAGWAYEGWVVGADGPISTGYFTDPSAADSDSAGPAAGANDTPPFPGQDFVEPATDLIGYAAVISVEPMPDNSAAPFALKPLVDMMIEDPGAAMMLQEMGNNAAAFPTGMASLNNTVDMTIDLMGLENLGDGWAYEGWLIVDGAPVTTGVFTIDDDGNMSQTTFTVSEDDAANASTFVLTIEPSPDDDPAPSDVHVLGGDFNSGDAALSVGHGAALGDDFMNAAGSYILAAPSGDNAPYQNGIWWLDPNGGPASSLDLPVLPAGWAYEGWVVGPDGPISTGYFTDPSAADSDSAGPAAGANDTPPFPGQDFVDPATDLIGYAAVISVEPMPDNSAAPFALKPLVDMMIEDPGAAMMLQEMGNNAAAFPTGMVSLNTTIDMTVDLMGLENLGDGWAYEGWLIVDGAPVTTGVFTIDDDGNMSQSVFKVSEDDATNASMFVLTIEPSPDAEPNPSDVHVLAGDLSNGAASLSVGHGAALGDDFMNAAGSYILAAPSGDNAPYQNGIWWLDPNGGPASSLDLPTLPAGWAYEGWVVGPDGPISTGYFTDLSAADSDSAGPAAGANDTPPFPGQDFVDPATDLIGYAAVISVEPMPDNSAAPFALKPLVDMMIEDPGAAMMSQEMGNNAGMFPVGMVMLSDGMATAVTLESLQTQERQNWWLLLPTLGLISLAGLWMTKRKSL